VEDVPSSTRHLGEHARHGVVLDQQPQRLQVSVDGGIVQCVLFELGHGQSGKNGCTSIPLSAM
jgi:hypothetical protein